MGSRRARRRRALTPYIFIAPWVVGFLVFVAFPAVFSLVMSTFQWPIVGQREFIGVQNYLRMLRDPDFFIAARTTTMYAALIVPISLGLSLSLAMLLTKEGRGMGFFKTAFYLPTLLTGVALAIVWGWILTDRGVLNAILEALGGDPVRWLNDPKAAIWAMVITTMFGQGAAMLIFLSALKNVPDELYESARIDGAGAMRRFVWITLPMISPAIVFNTILALIAAFQQITVVINLTGGGPNRATYFYALFTYNNAFQKGQLGYAAANSWTMLIFVLLLTLIFLRFSKRWSYYEV